MDPNPSPSTLATIIGPPDPGPYLTSLLEQAEATFRAARAPATLRAYEHDWKMFRAWCGEHHLTPLPAAPQSVILYATDLTANQHRSLGTLSRRLAAVSQLHQQMGFSSPTASWETKKFMAGLRRQLGAAPARKKPLSIDDLKKIVARIPDTLLGKRDRALLLLGFAGAFRRSELVSLNVEDCRMIHEGMTIQLRRSKTDQEGQGRPVGIPHGEDPATCPIQACWAWLRAAKIEAGPLFRGVNRHSQVLAKRLSAEAVAIVVKRYVCWLGYDVEDFAGHSLRAGLATAAAAAGKSERAIMQQTGHRSVTTVRRYIRDGNLFRDNAAGGLGL
jgi:site-specific recombinase XerD